jgi:hypothetical protein
MDGQGRPGTTPRWKRPTGATPTPITGFRERPQDPLHLQLSRDVDLAAIRQLSRQARDAARQGSLVRIEGDQLLGVDLGALQLLQKLLQEVDSAQLTFACPEQARTVRAWLRMATCG